MRFEELTTVEIARARDAGTALLLPVGAVEPHGPHLPLATDVLIACETARRAAMRVEAAGAAALVLPPISYSTVQFSAGFAGAVGVAARASEEALADLLVSLFEQGFQTVAVVNAHLEPAHVEAVRSAVAHAASRTGKNPIFPDITRRALAARLTEEFQSGACHAGRYETSLVMAIRPDLVREEIRRGLPAVAISLVDAIRAGRRNFREAGMDSAYCGDPAAATAAEGEATFETLAQIVADDVLRSLQGRVQGGIH